MYCKKERSYETPRPQNNILRARSFYNNYVIYEKNL